MATYQNIIEIAKPFVDDFIASVGERVSYDIDKTSWKKDAQGNKVPGRYLFLRIKYQKNNGKLAILDTLIIKEFSITELEPPESEIKIAEAALLGVPYAPKIPAAAPAPVPQAPAPAAAPQTPQTAPQSQPDITSVVPPIPPPVAGSPAPAFLQKRDRILVSFEGSPNVFDAHTGEYIRELPAGANVRALPQVRPSITQENQFAILDGRSLAPEEIQSIREKYQIPGRPVAVYAGRSGYYAVDAGGNALSAQFPTWKEANDIVASFQ